MDNFIFIGVFSSDVKKSKKKLPFCNHFATDFCKMLIVIKVILDC